MLAKRITVAGKAYNCEAGETVLDALLRQKAPVPYACRQQICKMCAMRSLNVAPPVASQAVLKDTLKAKNYFLACACIPEQDMDIALPEALTAQVNAVVVNIDQLSDNVVALLFECERQVNYAAGQSIVLMNHDKVGKNYFISSSTSQKENRLIEVHVPLVENSFFSDWVRDELNIGDTVHISCPMGQNFYVPNNLDQPILLIGVDEGLSPLIGIMQDALENDHPAPIYLFHGVKSQERLYLVEDLREITDYRPNFRYYPCIENADVQAQGFHQGLAHRIALQMLPDLTGWRVFICGKSDAVKSAQKEIYLAGASTKDIYAIFMS